MTMPRARVEAILQPLLARLERENPADKRTPDFWALRAANEYGLERGIFSIYLLNLVHLRPGQGTYQAAGVLHAYLEGVHVEWMASSDNVRGGGLTSKHMDVWDLLGCLIFDCGSPAILEGRTLSRSETVYLTPAEEFELSRIATPFGSEACGPVLLLALD